LLNNIKIPQLVALLFSIFFLPADYVLGEDMLPRRQALFSEPGAQHQLGLVD